MFRGKVYIKDTREITTREKRSLNMVMRETGRGREIKKYQGYKENE